MRSQSSQKILLLGASAEHEASRRFKSEFLIHMDGLLSDSQEGPLVLCTSNTPWDLDDALKRRLEKRIYIALPDVDARKHMFIDNTAEIDTDETFDPKKLGEATEGYSITICKSNIWFRPIFSNQNRRYAFTWIQFWNFYFPHKISKKHKVVPICSPSAEKLQWRRCAAH